MLEYFPKSYEEYLNALNRNLHKNLCILESYSDSIVEKECREYKLGCAVAC